MLGLSARSNGDADDLRAFVEANGVTFPILVDEDDTYGLYTLEEAASPYPIDLVVDADGVIVYVAREYDPEALRAAVEGVLP